MKKELEKIVLDRFKSILESRLPVFRSMPPNTSNLLPEYGIKRIWEWSFNPSLAFYVCIFCSGKNNDFFIETAWSEKARWPNGLVIKAPRDRQSGKPAPGKDGELIFRLAELWERQFPPAWEIESKELKDARGKEWISGKVSPPAGLEELLPRIEVLVNDAVDKIVQYGLPYFQEVATERGYSMSLDAVSTHSAPSPDKLSDWAGRNG